jgi:hypothetical protein
MKVVKGFGVGDHSLAAWPKWICHDQLDRRVVASRVELRASHVRAQRREDQLADLVLGTQLEVAVAFGQQLDGPIERLRQRRMARSAA